MYLPGIGSVDPGNFFHLMTGINVHNFTKISFMLTVDMLLAMSFLQEFYIINNTYRADLKSCGN